MKLDWTPEREANSDAIQNDYCMACGRIMDIANFIEMMLGRFIFSHIGGFTEDEIERLSFEEKKDTLMKFKSTGKLSEFNPYKNLMDDLNKIQYIRNAFGHGTLWTSKEVLDSYDGKYFELIKYKPDKGLEKFRINMRLNQENPDKKIFYIDKLILRGNRVRKWISPFVRS